MSKEVSKLKLVFVGLQLTLIGVVSLMLPLLLVDLSLDAFTGVGLILVLAGSIAVGIGVVN